MFKSFKCTFNMRKLKFRKLMAEKEKKVGSHFAIPYLNNSFVWYTYSFAYAFFKHALWGQMPNWDLILHLHVQATMAI